TPGAGWRKSGMGESALESIRGFRIVDGDGHVLEPPDALPGYAPVEYRDRIWHIETDAEGRELSVFDNRRGSSNGFALAGTAGMSHEDQARAMAGQLRYTECQRGAFEPGARLDALRPEGIQQSVIYPTAMLGIAAVEDHRFAAAQCSAYNRWISDYCSHAPDRLFAVGAVPQQDVSLTVEAIHECRRLGHAAVFMRPNPLIPNTQLNDSRYDPIWAALCETGLPVGLHPFLMADVPGACRALGLASFSFDDDMAAIGAQVGLGNIYFSQAIANPFDMMLSAAFLISGGVLERFPTLKVILLEANGGWIVPWLERLDHHQEVFRWDVPYLTMRPSEYFRRQCWISFDADEEFIAATANSPLCGADRIIWASDYPHPDAKFPGVVAELAESTASLSEAQRRRIFGENAAELYALPPVREPATV
ncbi:MAG TPA: amidohydrolase family protein, partial [Candidatus Dormibacteraeota bacterium]|nr:amidohydrolase family protein [Candidatus Dormibacteraeota bacterium]